MKKRWTVYECDRAGVPWDLCETDDPVYALKSLQAGRAARGGRYGNAFGVYLTDDPELGDQEAELEELAQPCEYCGKVGHQGGCRAQERHDARCL